MLLSRGIIINIQLSYVTRHLHCIHNRMHNVRRLAIARRSTMKMEKIWKGTGVIHNLNFKLIHSNIFGIAIYGCKSWAMTEMMKEEWMHLRCGVITECREFPGLTNIWVLEKIWTERMLRKTQERRIGDIHYNRKGVSKKERKTYKIMVRSLASVMSRTEDRKKWRDFVLVTAAYNVPSDYKK